MCTTDILVLGFMNGQMECKEYVPILAKIYIKLNSLADSSALLTKKPLRFIWWKEIVVNIAFHEDWVLDKEWIELGVFWLDLILSPPCPFTCAFLSFTTFSFLSVIGIFASPSELRSTILIPFSECQQLRCKSFSGFCCFGLSFMLSSLMAERFCGNYLLGSIVVMTYSLADYYKQQ